MTCKVNLIALIIFKAEKKSQFNFSKPILNCIKNLKALTQLMDCGHRSVKNHFSIRPYQTPPCKRMGDTNVMTS